MAVQGGFTPAFFPNNVASKEFAKEQVRDLEKRQSALMEAYAENIRAAAREVERLAARLATVEAELELLKGSMWAQKRAEVLPQPEKRGPGRPRKDAA